MPCGSPRPYLSLRWSLSQVQLVLRDLVNECSVLLFKILMPISSPAYKLSVFRDLHSPLGRGWGESGQVC